MKLKRKILIISQVYPSGATGTTVKTRNTILHLLRHGCDIDVCCVHNEKMVKNELSARGLRIYYVYTEILTKFTPRHIARALSLVFSPTPFRVEKLKSHKLAILISILTTQHSYDHVLFDGFSTLQYATKRDTRNIYIDDEDITDLLRRRYHEENNIFLKTFFAIEYWKCRWYEKKYLNRVSQIWAISQNSFDRLRTLSQAKNFFMPTLVSLQNNVFQKDSNNIVFTGLLSWAENRNGLIWFLKNHWSSILSEFPKTKLYVTGQLADKNLQTFLLSQNNIIYKGYVPDLATIYKHCALAVAPIQINAGIKVKILTYLSYGLPVVALRQATWGLTEQKGIISANESDFSLSVIKVLQDSQLRTTLSNEAQENIKNNHSNKILDEFFKKTHFYDTH